MYYNILYFIILSGGVEDGSGDGKWYGNIINTILSFNKREESWQQAGQMKKERSGHAVAAIDDVSQLCPWLVNSPPQTSEQKHLIAQQTEKSDNDF